MYRVRCIMETFLVEHNLVRLVLILSCLPVFAAAVYAAFLFRKLEKTLKLFSIFLFLSAVMQLASGIAWQYRVNNLPLLHIYVAGGFVCIALFYREVFSNFLNRYILLVTAIAFVAFTVINAIFFQSVFNFSSRTLTVESALVIILTLSTFMVTLNESAQEVVSQDRKSLNWINSGFFIYFSSNLLIFYFGDMFTRMFSVYLNQNTWILHSFFSIIMYTCFIIALWKRPKSLTF